MSKFTSTWAVVVSVIILLGLKVYNPLPLQTLQLKTIDLYTSNKYEIIIDNSISLLEITRNTDKTNDLIQFSDIKDGLINFKKTQNYNFISKKINTDNSVSLIIDLIQTETPTKIYYYNKNTRNIGGLINILSLDNRLNNVIP